MPDVQEKQGSRVRGHAAVPPRLAALVARDAAGSTSPPHNHAQVGLPFVLSWEAWPMHDAKIHPEQDPDLSVQKAVGMLVWC